MIPEFCQHTSAPQAPYRVSGTKYFRHGPTAIATKCTCPARYNRLYALPQSDEFSFTKVQDVMTNRSVILMHQSGFPHPSPTHVSPSVYGLPSNPASRGIP